MSFIYLQFHNRSRIIIIWFDLVIDDDDEAGYNIRSHQSRYTIYHTRNNNTPPPPRISNSLVGSLLFAHLVHKYILPVKSDPKSLILSDRLSITLI